MAEAHPTSPVTQDHRPAVLRRRLCVQVILASGLAPSLRIAPLDMAVARLALVAPKPFVCHLVGVMATAQVSTFANVECVHLVAKMINSAHKEKPARTSVVCVLAPPMLTVHCHNPVRTISVLTPIHSKRTGARLALAICPS
jgi:hypothetical protein